MTNTETYEILKILDELKKHKLKKIDLTKEKMKIEAKILEVNEHIRANSEVLQHAKHSKRIQFDKYEKIDYVKQVGKCEECGKTNDQLPRGKKLQIHHKIPVFAGGTNKKENLKVLCDDCHKKIHNV